MNPLSSPELAPNFREHEFRSGPRLLRRLAAPTPTEYRHNITILARTLSKIRDRAGRLLVTSGYRTPEYNKKVGGVFNSWHTKGFAADIVPLDCTLAELHTHIIYLEQRGRLHVGELGIYRAKGFIHLSIRGRGETWTDNG